jgi:hypothetical protein
MLLGEPHNTIKSHLVFTALFCFAPFSVFSSRMSAPHLPLNELVKWSPTHLVDSRIEGSRIPRARFNIRFATAFSLNFVLRKTNFLYKQYD